MDDGGGFQLGVSLLGGCCSKVQLMSAHNEAKSLHCCVLCVFCVLCVSQCVCALFVSVSACFVC